jgi:hypothetical protein
VTKLNKDFLKIPIPFWQGQSLTSKTIVVMQEQGLGLGDEIAFIRYAWKLAERAREQGGLILLSCWGPLETLFGRNLSQYADVLFVTTPSKVALQPQHWQGRTVLKSALQSLPLQLGETITNRFPYLGPDSGKAATWQERLSSDKGVKVGLSWTGRADHPPKRSVFVPRP